MIIPNCIKEAKAGDILATKYGNLLMFEHYEVEDNKLKVYSYFDYDGNKIYMNEWLTGFYGPKIDEDFFRIATTEECEKFIHLMYEYGYELHEEYGIPCWSLTALLSVLCRAELEKDYATWDDSINLFYRVKVYKPDVYVTNWQDNPVDACYEMILKLHELNLL